MKLLKIYFDKFRDLSVFSIIAHTKTACSFFAFLSDRVFLKI